MEIKQRLKEKILVMDGAMGTMIQKLNLKESDYRGALLGNHSVQLKGNYDVLTLTQPEIVKSIHRSYIESGADIIVTNTFSSNALSMSGYMLTDEIYRLNYQGALIAREVVAEFTERDIYVAGSIGPTNRVLSSSDDSPYWKFETIDFDALQKVYFDQVKGLVDGGVDVLLLETVMDIQHAKAALMAIKEYRGISNNRVPVMMSGVLLESPDSNNTSSIEKILDEFEILSLGFNCSSLNVASHRSFLESIAKRKTTYISFHPNAGLPNAHGDYPVDYTGMIGDIKVYMEAGLINIIGGCCGTTPDYVKALSLATRSFGPRIVVEG